MITLQLTPAEIAAFTAALERACDCPFIAEDDCAADLERLLGALEGAADLAAAWYQSLPHVNLFHHIMTRKIEREMNAAISENRNWSKANTSVVFDPETGESKVYLHGNHIADVGENYVRLFDGGWQSNTTKSRINAILGEHGISGEGVFQKQYQWFIRLYNGTEFFVTEFRNGMKLGALPYSLLLA